MYEQEQEMRMILAVSLIFGAIWLVSMMYQIRAGIYAKKTYNLLINQEKRWVRLHNEKEEKKESKD